MEDKPIVYTTSSPIQDFERLAVNIAGLPTLNEKRTAAVFLRDALRDAYGDKIATVAVGDKWQSVYDPEGVTAGIAEVQAFMKDNPQATEMQTVETLRNPIAGLYAHYKNQCGWDCDAETLTRATLMYTYALKQAAEAVRAKVDEIRPKAQTFHVDERLQTDKAKDVLSVLEGVSIQVKGKGMRRVLDTSTVPWSYASKAALRYVAKCVGNILNIQERWHVFEEACGVKNLQTLNGKEPLEVSNALIAAGYSDFDR